MLISLGRPLPKNIGHVTQWFGGHPEWYQKFGLNGHQGLDYGCPSLTPVLASHAGKVEYKPFDANGFGNSVIVRGLDYDTRYAHLTSVTVQNGTIVKRGDQIALSGNTGNSTGPHLHWQIQVHGMTNPGFANCIDPIPFRED